MKFTKMTEAEQAEFLELTKDCFDPDLHTEDETIAHSGRAALLWREEFATLRIGNWVTFR